MCFLLSVYRVYLCRCAWRGTSDCRPRGPPLQCCLRMTSRARCGLWANMRTTRTSSTSSGVCLCVSLSSCSACVRFVRMRERTGSRVFVSPSCLRLSATTAVSSLLPAGALSHLLAVVPKAGAFPLTYSDIVPSGHSPKRNPTPTGSRTRPAPAKATPPPVDGALARAKGRGDGERGRGEGTRAYEGKPVAAADIRKGNLPAGKQAELLSFFASPARMRKSG